MTRLRTTKFTDPGWTRRQQGKGFRYLDEQGRPLTGADRDRVVELVIPPAWTEVWITPYANGHLQAVGFDGAGRRQYLYHPQWRIARDSAKFERVVAIAPKLINARRTVARHLHREALGHEQILALAFRLLDQGLFRVGGEDYAVANESYGLATLLKRHVKIDGDELEFAFPAKSNKDGSIRVHDRLAAPIVEQLKTRRGGGTELLAYRAEGRWKDITSTDVNHYLKQLVGSDFSAKDLRTWHATVLAAVLFAREHADAAGTTSAAARKRAERSVMIMVSEMLGNTPTVARASYVDPRVVERFERGEVLPPRVMRAARVQTSPQPPRVELAVISLLS